MQLPFPGSSRFLVIALALFGSACSSDRDASGQSATVDIKMLDSVSLPIITPRDTVHIVVELAQTPAQHTMGLMERTSLAPHRGMLFLYPSVQSEKTAFWMFRTRIPLDIAFIDSMGVIRTLQTMSPCTSTIADGCPTYAAGARYLAALEMNGGFFSKQGVRVGDRLPLPTLSKLGTAP